jgi:hypothetical protein
MKLTLNDTISRKALISRPLKHVLPIEEVARLVSEYGFIAGSCARFMAHPEAELYNDIDVFCLTEDSFPHLFKVLFDAYGAPTGESPNAIRFTMMKRRVDRKTGEHRTLSIVDITLIKPFKNEFMQTYGDGITVLGQFDFTVAQVLIWWNDLDEELYVGFTRNFLRDMKDKRLVLNHINCPVAIAQRIHKYGKKGYKIGVREIMKLFIEWDKRTPEYRARLGQLLTVTSSLSDDEFLEMERLLRMD